MAGQNSSVLEQLTHTFQLRKRWILSSVIFLALVFTATLSFEKVREKNVYAKTETLLKTSNQALVKQLKNNILSYKQKLLLLSELPSVRQFILHQTQQESKLASKKADFSKDNLHTSFTAFLNNDPNIRQARLILPDGMEFVRVQRSQSEILAVAPSLLQSKQNRDYFKIGMRLQDDSVYISDISPNYEYGKIELPLWPTFRIIKKLKTLSGGAAGILVLNIDASELLNQLNNSPFTPNQQIENYLLDKDGYYLSAPDTEMLFGKDLAQAEMNWFVHTDNATALSNFFSLETRFKETPYLFTATEIHFSTNQESLPYFLITGIAKAHIEQEIQTLRIELYLSIAIISILLFLTVLWSIKYLRLAEQSHLNHSHFQAIIEHSVDAILSINLSGQILKYNTSATFLLGLPSGDNSDLNLFDLLDDNTSLTPDSLKQIIQKHIPLKVEVSLKNNHKHKRVLLATFCNIASTDKKNENFAVIIRDITHQKTNQKKLEDANTALDLKIKQRTLELEHEKQKALNANHNKSIFIANISHEIRTPLNAINGLLSLARQEENPEKHDEYLILAQESTGNLSELINDLLDLSKIESGKLDLDFKPCNLRPLLESVISNAYLSLKDKSIELIIDATGLEVQWIITDERRLKQILSNLINNAIKFTLSGEILLKASTFASMSLSADNGQKLVQCEFKVSDSGIGMTKEQQDKIFKPFDQASSSISNSYAASGLGLTISKKICERMNGSISLTSQIGQGSTFLVSFIATQYKTKIAERLEQAINLQNISILLYVKNDLLRRALDHQCSIWSARVNIVEDPKNIPALTKLADSETDSHYVLILEEGLLSAEQESNLPINLKTIYLNQNDSLTINPTKFYLPKPVLPSALLRLLLSIQNKEEILTNNLSSMAQPKQSNNEDHQKSQYKQHTPKHLVFVVDDNEINRIVGTGILSSLPVQLETANNGKVLLDKLRDLPENSAHIMIMMDCQMPVLDGYEATRAIRSGNAGEWLREIKIIAVTADVMSQNVAQCESVGMDAFISKPFDPTQLKSMVLTWIQENPE